MLLLPYYRHSWESAMYHLLAAAYFSGRIYPFGEQRDLLVFIITELYPNITNDKSKEIL